MGQCRKRFRDNAGPRLDVEYLDTDGDSTFTSRVSWKLNPFMNTSDSQLQMSSILGE